ncbi:MAG TPA: hypothetical protein DD723_09810, partial [Candidatus Omnitrophica bacterium]|nr:hypothetical protein [Candidatus Omnitrophota bacterium]
PLGAAAFLGALQLFHALRNEQKELLAELSGGVVFGAFSSSMLIAGGWSILASLAVWMILAVRAVTSIIYVRNKLGQERGEGYSPISVVGSHVLGGGVLLLLAVYQVIPWLVLGGYLVLCLRAVWGLGERKQTKIRPQMIGVQEVFLGLIYSVIIVVGYKFKF